jgi:hypothetical protein
MRSKVLGTTEILRIVLAVRAAVPGVGLCDEIQIGTHRWSTREAPALSISLEHLAEILKEEPDLVDPARVAKLMGVLCLTAAFGVHGDLRTRGERVQAVLPRALGGGG